MVSGFDFTGAGSVAQATRRVAFTMMSLVLIGVDLAAGMPWWWTASEGPGGVVFGALLLVLARPHHSKGGTA